MHWKVRLAFIERVEIFQSLGTRDLKAVARSCTEAGYHTGEYLCRQGERGVAAFLLVSGTVAVEAEVSGKQPLLLAELGQGSIVGELSIIDGDERVASVRALTEVDALVLTQWSFQGLLRSRPTIAASMLPVIVRRFRETTAELRRRDSDSVHARTSVFK